MDVTDFDKNLKDSIMDTKSVIELLTANCHNMTQIESCEDNQEEQTSHKGDIKYNLRTIPGRLEKKIRQPFYLPTFQQDPDKQIAIETVGVVGSDKPGSEISACKADLWLYAFRTTDWKIKYPLFFDPKLLAPWVEEHKSEYYNITTKSQNNGQIWLSKFILVPLTRIDHCLSNDPEFGWANNMLYLQV